MERARKGKYQKFGAKKKIAPVTKLTEGINKKFLITVNDNLFKFPEMSESIRDQYISKYSRVDTNLRYLSPIYFASAIVFLHDYPDGPNTQNFTDAAVKKYVSKIIPESPGSLTASEILFRRKIEFLRYIRLLLKMNDILELD
jgi:hypothetical protein